MNHISVGTPVFVKYGRVGIMDVIGELYRLNRLLS
jgi:ethanolamine ammonia-lyase small subunit